MLILTYVQFLGACGKCVLDFDPNVTSLFGIALYLNKSCSVLSYDIFIAWMGKVILFTPIKKYLVKQ